MKQIPAIFLILFLFGALFLSVTVAQQTFGKSAKDSKARRDIDKAIGRAVEGNFSSVKTVNISTYVLPNEALTVYNKTSPGSLPPIIDRQPEPPVCNRNDHVENNTCVPDNPAAGYKICMVGDLSGNAVPDAMSAGDCNFKIGIGDLGYKSDLSYFKGLNFDRCVVGNHESDAEDGNAALEKETLTYCGDSWWVKFGSSTLLMAFNTNGDTKKQLDAAKNLLAQNENQGMKNIILLSHKGGHVSPNSHHPAEAKSFYTSLEKLMPSSAKLYEVFAHNHVMSASDDNRWYESGAGGRNHYACGQNEVWNFCNNKAFGYLQATLNPDDTLTVNFIDTTGKIVH